MKKIGLPFGFFVAVLMLAEPAIARFDTAKFLSSAWRDPAVQMKEASRNEFGSSSFINPVEKMQLRLGQGHYVDQRKGSVRLYTRGFSEYRLMRGLRSQETQLEQTESQAQLGKALSERYEALLAYAHASEKRKLAASLLKSVSSSAGMTKLLTRASSASGADLLKAKASTEEAQLDLAKAEMEEKLAVQILASLDSGAVAGGEPMELLTPEQMLSNLDKLKLRSSGESSAVRLARAQAQLKRDEGFLDVEKDGRLIDYFEVSMSEDREERRYSLEVAINIPGFSGSDHKARERSRSAVNYEIEAHEADRENAQAATASRTTLEQFAATYRTLKSASETPGEERIKKLARNQDPLLAASLERASAQRAMALAEIHHSAAEAYLAYLVATDALIDHPRTNFFSASLGEISP